MPEMAQEPLTPLTLNANIRVGWNENPPPFYGLTPPTNLRNVTLTMLYNGDHTWSASTILSFTDWKDYIFFGTYYQARYACGFFLRLYWPSNTIVFSADLFGLDNTHAATGGASTTLTGCERGSPWTLPRRDFETHAPNILVDATAYRAPNPLLPIIATMSASPTVAGPLDGKLIEHKPRYPDGAIPGETPPTHKQLILRQRATIPFTENPGQLRKQSTFTAAAAAWHTLTNPQQLAWHIAGSTLRPPLTGYQAWIKTALSQRLDRIPILEARIGQTLPTPPLPP